jgi:hypothetical protein
MLTEDGYFISRCLDGETEAFGFLIDKYKASFSTPGFATFMTPRMSPRGCL